MSNDRQYETLHELTTLGRIPPDESARLEEHLNQCGSCRKAYQEFEKLIREALSADAGEEKPIGWFARLFSRPSLYKRRFAAKAEEHGIHFSLEAAGAPIPLEEVFLPWLRQYYKFAVLILLLLGALGLFGYRLRESQLENAAMTKENTDLTDRIDELRQQVAALSETNRSLDATLTASRQAQSRALARIAALEERSERLSQEINSLQGSLALGAGREEQLEKQLTEAEQTVAQATTELQELHTQRRVDAATIAARQSQIDELAERLDVHLEKLDRAGRLMAADRDIRELMGARKLHIIDVFDVDDRGKTKRPFGRVFYTEGKSLIFYAFDLEADKFTPAKYSFQAWGYREPAVRTAQSLGIFYMDDEKQKRWILRFDDPDVLAEIDAIFVTVEPFGGAAKPTGRKLLYAYMKNKPNHP